MDKQRLLRYIAYLMLAVSILGTPFILYIAVTTINPFAMIAACAFIGLGVMAVDRILNPLPERR